MFNKTLSENCEKCRQEAKRRVDFYIIVECFGKQTTLDNIGNMYMYISILLAIYLLIFFRIKIDRCEHDHFSRSHCDFDTNYKCIEKHDRLSGKCNDCCQRKILE